MIIPFNKPHITGREYSCMAEAVANGQLSGDGPFTKKCNEWLEKTTGAPKALLTHSCTAALEMSAILADIKPGDEVIMPSYSFVSTANAFVLRGGIPVFVDIRADTLNIDESRIEEAVTERTKAIVVVHYAGVACEMEAISAIAAKRRLLLIEDAAQGILCTWRGRPLGTLGDLGTLSFHETKNIHCGEGGALLINNDTMVGRAEIIREKGTNRSKFFRGEVDKYTWVDLGSSYLPSDLSAAFLWAQMEEAEGITTRRLKIWNRYHEAFEDMEKRGVLRRPVIPNGCLHNAHMYYLLLPDLDFRTAFIGGMRERAINTVFHYVPLHNSTAGKKFGRVHGVLKQTEQLSEQLARLPLWPDMQEEDVNGVIQGVMDSIAAVERKSTRPFQ
ncbi:MAG: dTDP-4-amino-4,6-dideoxygalactose transaminase [bacterium]